jgi:outer membrane lipoprotein SlyB
MKSPSHKQSRYIITILIALAAITVNAGCSQKPSAEQTAAQTQAAVDKAVEETKKQMIAEQEAAKAKQEADLAAQAEEKRNQEAAVATAKKELIAEQRRAAAKARSKHALASPVPPPVPAERIVCTNCGVVVSVNAIQTEGQGSGLGVVAGGVVGGLLGNQVGSGSGRDLATLAGAFGGAIAGNKIEKTSKKTTSYDITVRMDTGEERIVHQDTVPNVVKGDKVRIENDAIVNY